MKDENEKQVGLDILKHIEELSNQINNFMSIRTRSVFRRYPLTFMLLILVGVVAVSEGLKDIITHISFFAGHPWKLFFVGLIILVITGTLYKKLDK
ncbi:MAG: hypothetical protein WCW47_02045 [Candidatus Paceibacterota bacterium]|jgi:hypothetical protein